LDRPFAALDHITGQCFQQFQEVPDVIRPTPCDLLPRDMREVIIDQPGDKTDDSLYLLSNCEFLITIDAIEVDAALGEDDLAYLEVGLDSLEDAGLFDPSGYS
jgi:hypothetical protein